MACKRNLYISRLLLLLILFNFCFLNHSIDTITPTQFISDNENGSVVSSDGSFKLGFFSPGKSRARYVGIWLNKISQRTVVWVANRATPIKNSAGVFKIGEDGNVAVFCGNESTSLWSTNVSVPTGNSNAKLLDSGNLVLVAGERIIWQSFDYPTDTNLPGMRFGVYLNKGLNHMLTSWKSIDDPSPGDFSLRTDPDGMPQLFLYKGSVPYCRGGPWNGRNLNGVPDVITRRQDHEVDYSNQIDLLSYTFVSNENESYMEFSSRNGTVLSIIVLEPTGTLKRLIWHESHKWATFWMAPQELCDDYARCGANAICNEDTMMHCTCLPGFEPLHPRDWYLDCVETRKMNGCGKGTGEGFVTLESVKLPDARISTVYRNMSLDECARECLQICNCSGYATLDVIETGKGCILWHGDQLKDIRQYKDGQDFYLRVDAVELAAYAQKNLKQFLATPSTLPFIVVLIAVEVLLIAACSYYMWKKHSKRKGRRKKQQRLQFSILGSARNWSDHEYSSHGGSTGASGNVELTLFDLSTIITATNNFSSANRLGRGGFGPVYKGQLPNGQKIAVKRLSKDSGQGIDEFKNEVSLVAKLQHRNLVRLLGCCIEDDEKILIYEFMPNKSLNYFIFDQSRKLLDWKKRFDIIIGIARGILYLHQDSRLRIIHRDLKASNILLDEEMKPKISDFGTARIFGGDQTQGNTKRVIGTFGYMSPEYMLGGLFSTKSDVYSFGVLLLKIISGKKNQQIFHDESSSNLIRYTWELWRDEKALEIVDSFIVDSYHAKEVLKCIHVGLLCVQDHPRDRPSMSTVVFMLSNETTLPSPKQPTFTIRTSESDLPDSRTNSINEVSITTFEAR